MRLLSVCLLLLCGVSLLAGCGSGRPEPPEGYVDPSTDPAAMGETLQPGAPSETPAGTP